MKKLLFILLATCTLSAIAAETVPHHISATDNLFRLSLRYHTTVPEIIAANPGLKVNAVQVGQTILVPINTKMRDPEVVATLLNQPAENTSEVSREEIVSALFAKNKAIKPADKMASIQPSKSEATGNINVPKHTTASYVGDKEEVQFVSIDDLAGVVSSAKSTNNEINTGNLQQRYNDLKKMESEEGNVKVVDVNALKIDAATYSRTLDKINTALLESKTMVVNLKVVLKDGSTMTISNPDEQKRFLSQIINSDSR